MKKIILTSMTLAVLSICQSAQAEPNITEWQKTRFAQLDTDKNGNLNAEELRGTTQDWMSKAGYSEEKQITQTEKKFTRMDTNKDKQVSVEEFSNELNKQKKQNKNKNKNKNK